MTNRDIGRRPLGQFVAHVDRVVTVTHPGTAVAEVDEIANLLALPVPDRQRRRRNVIDAGERTHHGKAVRLTEERVRFGPPLGAGTRADEDDRYRGRRGIATHSGDQLTAVHPRHHEIGRDHVGRHTTAFDLLDRCQTICGLNDVMAGKLERHAQQKAHARLVVHDQDVGQPPYLPRVAAL
jgi:hypothetical protein